MKRWTFFGSAARAACARATGPVSACERYSTPAGDLYWTDWPNAADAMLPVATMVAAMSLDDRAIGFAPFPRMDSHFRLGSDSNFIVSLPWRRKRARQSVAVATT